MATTSVESSNVVGYQEQSFEVPRTLSVTFQGVGSNGAEVDLTALVDGNRVADYEDTLEIYDPYTGDFTAYMWDTETWFNASTDEPFDVYVVPGNSFIVSASSDWRVAGEVPADGYQHPIEPGIPALIGSAYPVETTLANFDWSGIADYEDTLETYDAYTGDFIALMWDTEQWFNASTDEPVASSTSANDGFILSTGLSSITQHVSVQSN